MRQLITVILFLSTATAMASPVGDWTGAIEVSGIKLKIEVSVSENDGELTATISIPQQGARNLTLTNTRGEGENIYFELDAPPGVAKFDGKFNSPDRIEGNFNQGLASGTFHLSRAAGETMEGNYGEAVSVTVEGGELHGSLVVPEGIVNPPVALIIAGSGPTDRDGNTQLFGSFNNSLKMLAEALEQNGVASLRFDKRGIGESMPGQVDQPSLRIEDFMNDASAWIEFLLGMERFGDVFVVGHSEGVLIGMVAARGTPIAGFVSIAGVGRSADKLLKEQLTKNIPNGELADAVAKIIDELAEGKTVIDVPAPLVAALDASVQPYLVSWFKYDPTEEIRKLSVPILIVQGTTDLQIDLADARKLDDAAKDSKVVVVQGMNHILKQAEGDLMAQVPIYGDPDLPLHKELVEPIVNFIRSD